VRRVLALLVVSCIPGPVDLTGKTCANDADCGDLPCRAGVCGGTADSGTPDAGPADAGTPDAGGHVNLQANSGLDGPYGAVATLWDVIVVQGVPDSGHYGVVDAGPPHQTAMRLERTDGKGQPVVLQPEYNEWTQGIYGTLCTSAWVRSPGGPLNPTLTLSFQLLDGGNYPKQSGSALVLDAWTQLTFSWAAPDAGYDRVFPAVAATTSSALPLLVDDIEVWQGNADGGCD
jgi:hypothetical protein